MKDWNASDAMRCRNYGAKESTRRQYRVRGRFSESRQDNAGKADRQYHGDFHEAFGDTVKAFEDGQQ